MYHTKEADVPKHLGLIRVFWENEDARLANLGQISPPLVML
jgi:hypothetical protein